MPKDYSQDSASLARRASKLAVANERLRAKHRLLKVEAKERAAKLQELWGFLTDIKSGIEMIRKDGDPGDWTRLVETVNDVVNDYTQMEATKKKADARLAESEAYRAAADALVDYLQGKLECAEGSLKGALGTLWMYLRRKLRKIRVGA